MKNIKKDVTIITKKKEEEQREPIGLEARCWSCEKVWNVSLLPNDAKAVRCSCGGFVVTESGKIMSRSIYDEFESTAPLLGKDDYKPIIITD